MFACRLCRGCGTAGTLCLAVRGGQRRVLLTRPNYVFARVSGGRTVSGLVTGEVSLFVISGGGLSGDGLVGFGVELGCERG